ncbi:hypothetical protein INT43_007060 [Umbelopsis isabellina]|uniref:Uncharacterized protein n=1 Tax=Mortierella isabellina TaxID=91625 RepID=A0A8H7PXK9_MORIS|nr:hypothetical protein INT43_007060 [Umbelopsis isabellina]
MSRPSLATFKDEICVLFMPLAMSTSTISRTTDLRPNRGFRANCAYRSSIRSIRSTRAICVIYTYASYTW